MTQTFVPNDFEVPESLVNEYFRLEVLEPSVAEIDYGAVMSSPHFSPGVCRQPVEQLVVATAGLDVLHRVLWARDHAHQLVQATFWFISALAAINIL